MAQAEIRLAIAGTTLNYAVESVAGVRPVSGFEKVPEVTDIPEMSGTDYDTIDMTPIDETVQHQEITGLRGAPGTLTFEANLSDTLLEFWEETLIPAYNEANAEGKKMWFCLIINGMDQAYYWTGAPKALAPGGGGASDGWKCTLPISMTNTPEWFERPNSGGDARLSALTIGTNALTPSFSSDTLNYAANTTSTTDAITAAPVDGEATVSITSTDATISGTTATWATGPNLVTITVTNGGAEKVYKVTVTKS